MLSPLYRCGYGYKCRLLLSKRGGALSPEYVMCRKVSAEGSLYIEQYIVKLLLKLLQRIIDTLVFALLYYIELCKV